MSSQQSMSRNPSSSPFSNQDSFNNDIDSWINYDGTFPSPSPTLPQVSFPSSSGLSQTATSSHSATGFSGPSHQYDRHPQQTGSLPVDADYFRDLIPSSMSPDNNQYMQFGSDYLSPLSNDMMSAFGASTDFVNPGAISPFDALDTSIKSEVGLVSAPPPPPPPPVATAAPMTTAGRYYPGIHQQQAVFQQQQMWQLQQKTLESQTKTVLPNNVEESVEKIMNSLRIHKASATARSPSVLPNIPKLKKKDEDEMDEDERLLASEEGKKLTSKERRQLRNKVSARAFRSRRKGYIMDLEEEIRKSKDENVELQSENARLREENAKISEFTKTLLSSPAFSAYLAATIESGTAASSVPEAMTTTASNPEPIRPTRKDVNPNLSVPEDSWPLAYNSSPWAANSSTVFAITELPEGPSIQDMSGKAVDFDDSFAEHKLNPLSHVADGFYPFRNEKSGLVSNSYSWDDDEYEAPEDLMDAYDEEYGVPAPKELEDESKSLDELFPGHGVNTLLERLEMIVGGQAKPEDFFEEATPTPTPTPTPAQEAVEEMDQDIEKEVALVEANGLLDAVEGIYRRIGLLVGS